MTSKTLETPEKRANQGQVHATVRVVITYAAAVRPYKAEVAETTTIGELKTAVLNAFGLKETGNKVYKLFHGGKELLNMAETVGDAAGGHHELALQLEEVVVQG
jgi:hypothetical protein